MNLFVKLSEWNCSNSTCGLNAILSSEKVTESQYNRCLEGSMKSFQKMPTYRSNRETLGKKVTKSPEGDLST